MCGIAGILSKEELNRSRSGSVKSMISIIQHRGPDNSNVKSYDYASLGQARLSIIDLSKKSDQPMDSLDGQFVIVFNGEIYNYKELREELKSFYNFRSKGDTEVLLAAWQKWGLNCLDKIKGMFAFCIWDKKNKKAYLVRDRFGQKPLYYYWDKKNLIFCSEIKGILATGVKAKTNNLAWLKYLAYASYDDNSSTFFDGIKQLKAGQVAIWSEKNDFKISNWYNLSEKVIGNLGFIKTSEKKDELKHKMLQVINMHVRSDVPVGISLSGGLDSSAILACLKNLNKNFSLEAYSVKFQEKSNIKYSEEYWIKKVADYYNIPLTMETYKEEDMLKDIAPMIWHNEGPLGGLMHLGRAKVMRNAKENGIKVMLDGTGLDECYAGYQVHHDLYLSEKIKEKNSNIKKLISDYIFNWKIDKSSLLEKLKNFDLNNKAIDSSYLISKEMLNEKSIKALSSISPLSYNNKSLSSVKSSLIDYMIYSKIPKNTRFTDRMSMAHGVELRLPFLDHELVELGLTLDDDLYFLEGRTKSFVRETLKGMIEDDVLYATKRSVHTPQGEWMKKEPIRSYILDTIHSISFQQRGLVDKDKVKVLYRDFCENKYNNSFFIWQWVNMEEWHKTFIDKDATKKKNKISEVN